jgi:hypothetical protein
MEDLQALYATMRQGRVDPAGAAPQDKDFESTRPGEEPGATGSAPRRW